jgi:SH3-like domain-containing protein
MERSRLLALLAALSFAGRADAAYLSVSSARANVRSGPGLGYETIWTVERHSPLWFLGEQGDWIEFRDADGDEGWIHRDLTSTRPSVIVVGEYANVREGPGLGHGVAWVVYRRHSLRVLDREGDWLQVSDGEEVEGWIHRRLVWGAKGDDARGEA